MTKISSDDVARLATMSSLALDETQAEHLRADLENILTHVDQLSGLDTEGVEPTYQVTGLENVFREDVVEQGINGEELVSLAESTADNQIKVPKVL